MQRPIIIHRVVPFRPARWLVIYHSVAGNHIKGLPNRVAADCFARKVAELGRNPRIVDTLEKKSTKGLQKAA